MVYRCVGHKHIGTAMQPGYRTRARARRPDALETLFADETVSAPTAPAPLPQAPQAADPPRPVAHFDLQLFAEEPAWQPNRSRRSSSLVLPGSPYAVAVLAALFTVASPFFLSRRAEPERSDAVTVVAQQTSEVSASATDLPAATPAPIVEPPAPRSVEPPGVPKVPAAVEPPLVKRQDAALPTKRQVPPPPAARESTRPFPTNTPVRGLAATAAPPPQPAVIPALQPAPRAVETLGTLPVSLVAPPLPASPP